MRLLLAPMALLLAQCCMAADLIGGGQRVFGLQQLDETRVKITVQGETSAETYVVDCIGATWGFERGSQMPVKADQRSQVVAERACRNIEFKAALLSEPGSWMAPAVAKPVRAAREVDAGPSSLRPEPLAVPSDPKAKFHVLGIEPYQGNIAIITHRISPSGETFSKREIDCHRARYRYLGTGETREQMEVLRPDANLGDILPRAIPFYVARRACRGVPGTAPILLRDLPFP